MKNKVVKTAIGIASFLLIFLLPVLLLLAAVFLSPVYDDTYYAALGKQYDRLAAVEEKKVVLVGGSNIAFGADSELFQRLDGRPLVSFGLYGVFGTKLMMDLSKTNLNCGDTVILCPELSPDAYSLHANFEALLKASERKAEMLFRAETDDKGKLAGALLPFALAKREYLARREKPVNDGVYAYSAVNAYGEIGKGLRKGNRLRAGYLDEEILSSLDSVDGAFIEYVNDYAAWCRARGVRVCFSFPPVNAKALEKKGIDEDKLYGVYDGLTEKLSCEVISDPNDYVYDYRYFYDTNFHLNDSGAVLRTVQLVRDLKLAEGNNDALEVSLPGPPAPEVPTVEIDETLEYTDSRLFRYAEEDGLLVLVGVEEAAKSLESIVIPVAHEGKYIYKVAGNAFVGCDRLQEAVVPVGITELSGGAFNGCGALRRIYFYETSGSNVNVYDGTFSGAAADCKIVLTNASREEFVSGYFWQRVTLEIVEERR